MRRRIALLLIERAIWGVIGSALFLAAYQGGWRLAPWLG